MTSRESSRKIPLWKKGVYGAIATCAFFLLLEILLGLAGIRPPLERNDPFVGFERIVPLFEEVVVEGVTMMETAANKQDYFNLQRFPKAKGQNAFRIFCVGGSTTYGRPYNDATSYVAWTREILELADKSRQWEVINAGGISYASYRVASLMDELCEYSPDLFIIYCGHNEFLEERTYRDLQSRSKFLQYLIHGAHRTRIYQVARQVATSRSPVTAPGWILPSEVDAVLDHTVGPVAYHRDPPLRKAILEHFEFNLERMIKRARSVGAEVLLVTPALNLRDFSPFKSEFLAELSDAQQAEWDAHFFSACEMNDKGEFANALASLQTAAALDAGRADLHFEMGRSEFHLGRFSEARTSFQKAVDEDVCPLRAISAIQRIVQETALLNRVPLIDFPDIVKNDCLRTTGHSIAGREHFVDHVHPTVDGHRLLAMAIIQAMELTGKAKPIDSWRELVGADIAELIASRMDAPMQTRALTNLAQVLSWAGKQEEAGPLALEAVNLRKTHSLPDDPESLFYAGVYLATVGEDERAVEFLNRVVTLQDRNVQAQWRLGALYYDAGKYELARLHLAESVSQGLADPFVHHLLGMTLLHLKEFTEARVAFERAHLLAPTRSTLNIDLELLQQAEIGGAEPSSQ
jgi:tetratricopeptide (TPR) repeat protein